MAVLQTPTREDYQRDTLELIRRRIVELCATEDCTARHELKWRTSHEVLAAIACGVAEPSRVAYQALRIKDASPANKHLFADYQQPALG